MRRHLLDMGLIVTSAVRRQLCDVSCATWEHSLAVIVTSAVRRQLCDASCVEVSCSTWGLL